MYLFLVYLLDTVCLLLSLLLSSGVHCAVFLAICPDKDVRITVFCTCLQVTAVFAADAVSRLSGVVGVAAVTAGPGMYIHVQEIKHVSE